MDNADTIKRIIRYLECEYEVIVRVVCPLCNTKRALLLIGRTGQYECLVCSKHGKLSTLITYCEDKFEHRHKATVKAMQEKKAVEKIGRG